MRRIIDATNTRVITDLPEDRPTRRVDWYRVLVLGLLIVAGFAVGDALYKSNTGATPAEPVIVQATSGTAYNPTQGMEVDGKCTIFTGTRVVWSCAPDESLNGAARTSKVLEDGSVDYADGFAYDPESGQMYRPNVDRPMPTDDTVWFCYTLEDDDSDRQYAAPATEYSHIADEYGEDFGQVTCDA